jgi:hypothetical protein
MSAREALEEAIGGKAVLEGDAKRWISAPEIMERLAALGYVIMPMVARMGMLDAALPGKSHQADEKLYWALSRAYVAMVDAAKEQ